MADPGKRPMITWDLTLSVVTLIVSGLLVAFGILVGVMSVLFLDYCPPATCSADGAVAASGIAMLAAVAIGIGGMVLTITRIVRRRISWPFSVGTFVLCLMVLALGFFAYRRAVGA